MGWSAARQCGRTADRSKDIAYVGSAVGTAWGHGFYFADSASTSMGYTGGGVRVTEVQLGGHGGGGMVGESAVGWKKDPLKEGKAMFFEVFWRVNLV